MNNIVDINGFFGEDLLNLIADKIKNNKIIIMPSDTIYGFLCRINQEQNLRNIKKRDTKPFLYLISNLNQVESLNINVDLFLKFFKKYWPGPVTFLVNDIKGNKIGIRNPDFLFLNKLITMVDEPLISTSVNYSGQPSMNDINTIIKEFKNKVDCIIRDKNYKPSIASTIVDLTVNPIKIIREGSIKIEEAL
jgi:L-threonylcarbamoyladenylate synthase